MAAKCPVCGHRWKTTAADVRIQENIPNSATVPPQQGSPLFNHRLLSTIKTFPIRGSAEVNRKIRWSHCCFASSWGYLAYIGL